MTTIVSRQPIDDCPHSPAVRCEMCPNLIEIVKGHRHRRYCSDTCKQKAYQQHKAQKESGTRRARLCAAYPDWASETIGLLDGFAALDNQEMVEQIAAAISREVEVWQQGLDQVQERFRMYVQTTNERLSELTGELAKLRQEQERAAGQEEQHNIEDYREKLAQAGQRVAKLEKQVDIQRQQIGQYHARFYPSSLSVAMERLLALGAVLGYPPLLKYDVSAVGIAVGAQAWQEFARTANYDDMAQAILQAQRFQQQVEECHRSQADEQEAAVHRLIVQEYAARLYLSFEIGPIPLERDGTTYSIVTGNLPNHKVVAKLPDGDKQYETLEISDQEVTYFQEYCYRQLCQTYQARLAV